mgnify:CR=1 FL=1
MTYCCICGETPLVEEPLPTSVMNLAPSQFYILSLVAPPGSRYGGTFNFCFDCVVERLTGMKRFGWWK